MIKFPKGFLYGTATSATQSEGAGNIDNKSENIWDYWYKIEPYKFYKKVGPSKTTDIYNNYKTDVDLLEETGQNVYRTSINWARLLPDIDGNINQKAVSFYRDYFSRIRKKNITLYINLFHFDLPMYLMDIGGWTNKKTVEAYKDYSRKCFELFDDLVDGWFTFNEPIVQVECQYLYGYHYPAEVDPKKAVQAAFNTQLASALAIKSYKEMEFNKKIGIILNLTPAYPRSNNDGDLKAAEMVELINKSSFLDPSVFGKYPEKLINLIKNEKLTPEYSQEELEIIKENTIDFLGVNYYQPLRVRENPYQYKEEALFMPSKYYLTYDMPGKRMNPYRGWEIYPKALYDIAINIRDNYKNIEWIVSENGMGVENEERFRENGQIKDDYRIDFIKEHLYWLNKAIREGANCKGYQLWTFIDCWSWLNAYKNRYGLVELDLKTGQRKIKKSGQWFKKLSENNGFEL